MARQPYTYRHYNTFYFRMRVPADLKAHFDGRPDIRFSLKTRDPAEVKRRAAYWSHRYAERLAQLCDARRRAYDPEPRLVIHVLDEETVDGLTNLWI